MFTNGLFDTIVIETNRYYQQHSQEEEKKNSATRCYSIWNTISFPCPNNLMGHDDRDTMKDCWSTNELYHTPFYSEVISTRNEISSFWK
jgi:hypothetical protein